MRGSIRAVVSQKQAWERCRPVDRRGAHSVLSHRRANPQILNPKLQRNPGIETPKTKLQTPKKSQVPSSKPRPALREWSFSGVWSLVFGVWSLRFGVSLEFGFWYLEL